MLRVEGLNDASAEDNGFFEDFENLENPTVFVSPEDDGGNEDKEVLQRRREAEAIYGADSEVGSPPEELPEWENIDQSETFTITRLGAGVRDPNRVNVFLDTKFAFSLDVTQVVDFNLKVGKQINKKELKELQRASEFGKMYQRTLEWVLTRPHSIRETQNYLRRRQIKRRQTNRMRERDGLRPFPEFNDEIIELVMERLIEKKYLNDQKFAEYFVENRYVRKGISQKRLRRELTKKGVSREIAEKALAKIPRDEDEEVMKIIKKKRCKYDDHRLLGYLVRQGFPFQTAKEALERYAEEGDDAR